MGFGKTEALGREGGSVVEHVAISCYSSRPPQTKLLATLQAIKRSLQHFSAAYIFTDCLNAVMHAYCCKEG